MVGNTVLGYRVDEKIGSGGFGTVYKVSKTNAAGTYVRALKHITLPSKKQYTSVLNSMGGDYSKADDYFASILKDIVSEIRILSTLSESGTQNIVRYYENDIVETSSPKTYDIYILMEYLTPFTDYVESNSFTIRDVIKLGKDILKALMACHEKNIIHRDIKDDNIFISPDGVYKLGDFGVSKALKDKSRAESVKGTPNFIAPEVYLGKEKYDNTVDFYSLGIVLYKLLNKARNPFLPKYPAPYSSQDEDSAFEARMTGKIPSLPISAENELGEAVLKAIKPRQDRYNSAAEFYEALQTAENTLSADYLSIDLGLGIPKEFRVSKIPSQTIGTDMHNNETVGSDILKNTNETIGTENDRHLFDTIGTNVEKNNDAYEAPKAKPDGPGAYNKKAETPYWDTYTPPVAPPKVKAIAKSDFKWLVYLSPVLIIALWLAVYMILIPQVYGEALTVIEWVIEEPSVILDVFEDANNILIPIYKIILLKVYNWLTVVGFITSLFFVGKTIQNSRPKQSDRASLHGKEAYLMTMSFLEEIKVIGNSKTEAAKKAVYYLNEKLRNESNFGEGSDSVINCENEIATYLNEIQGLLPGLRNENSVDEATRQIELLAQRCLAKLKNRTELKKK